MPHLDITSCKLGVGSGDASVREVSADQGVEESNRFSVPLSSGSLLGGGSVSATDTAACYVCEEIEIVARGTLSDSDAASDANTCGGSSFFLGSHLSPILELQERSNNNESHGYASQHSRVVGGVGDTRGAVAAQNMDYGSLGGHKRRLSRRGLGTVCHSRTTSVGSLGYSCHSRSTSLGSTSDVAADSTVELMSRRGKENDGDFPFW